MRRLLLLIPAVLIATLFATAPGLATHTVTVWSGEMAGWELRTSDGGAPSNTATATFVPGPGTPPLGSGSLQLAVGTNGAGAAEIRTSGFSGTLLANMTALSYWSYVSVPGSGGQAPYIIASVDLDADAASDDLLFFEPVYQDGSFSGEPVPDQGTVTTDVWQEWDAAAGGWWSLDAGTFGPPLVTLDSYAAANPGARLLTLRIVAGFGAGAWDDFVGNADAVMVGTPSHVTTFDFEVAPLATPTPTATPTPAPGDGTPTPTPDAAVAGAAATAEPSPGAGLLPDTATTAHPPHIGWGIALAILAAAFSAGALALRGSPRESPIGRRTR